MTQTATCCTVLGNCRPIYIIEQTLYIYWSVSLIGFLLYSHLLTTVLNPLDIAVYTMYIFTSSLTFEEHLGHVIVSGQLQLSHSAMWRQGSNNLLAGFV